MDNKFFELFGEGVNNKNPAAVGSSQGTSTENQLPTPPTRNRAMAADKIEAATGGGAPAPAAAPQEAAPAAPSASGIDRDKFNSLFGGGQASQGTTAAPEAGWSPSMMNDGSLPIAAIPESPLSIMDRARLGWVRTPQNQHIILENEYGKGNVALVPVGEGEMGFTVKNKDGKWYQVDPHLAWSKLGPLSYPSPTAKNMADLVKDAPGDLAQFAGEYGLRAAGAAVGAGVGGAAGAAVGGPAAPVTGFLGAVAGAGVGASSAEGLDMLSRMAMPQGTPGTDMATYKDLPAQMQASFLFGAEQEMGGQMFKLGGKASVYALAKTINALSDTPGGRYLASKILGTISGQGPAMARIRVDDPMGVAKFDGIAMDDAVNNTNKLGDMMKDNLQSLYDGFVKRKQLVFGQQYDAIEESASKLNFDPMKAHGAKLPEGSLPSDPTTDLFQSLKDNGYLVNGKPVNYKGSNNIERQITPTEASALNYVVKQGQNIAQKTIDGSPTSFQEMKNLIGTLDNQLYTKDGIQDGNLRRILGEFRVGLKNNVIDTMKASDPEMANKYVQLDQKYGPVKNLMEQLSTMTDDQKVDGFLKKITKQDGSFNSDLLQNISDLMGTKDPTGDLLKMHVAQNSTDFLGGQKMLKIIPGSPLAVSRAVTGYSQAKQALGGMTQIVPYLNQTMSWMKGLPADTRNAILKNPQAVEMITKMMGSASQAEQDDTKKLLQSAGIQPPQQ